MASAKNTMLLLAAITSGLTGCRALDLYEHFHRQLPSFADMLNISRQISESHATGVLTVEDVERITARYNEGTDRWGTRFVVHVRRKPAPSYLLVSLGADRRLDVSSVEEYYNLAVQDISDEPNRDIVFRDGEAITIASRK